MTASNRSPVSACSCLWEDSETSPPTGVTPIDFALSPDQEAVRDAIAKICARFDEDYWLKRDREGGFPHDFHQALAEGGWLGIAMPEEYGGSGLGITEAALMMQTIAESGAAFPFVTLVDVVAKRRKCSAFLID